jgi:prepilin-type N-terminal cleavage/methylation domain-containing protein
MMRERTQVGSQGFSLLEMMISLALGGIILGAAVSMFSRGMNATWTISQRAEMQQDYRAASNLLVKDIGLAGSGLDNAVIALPSGTGKLPIYGCDATGCHINGGGVAFPTENVSGTNVPYLYGLIPGNKFGPTLNAAQGPTDIVTVAYVDNNFLLNCYDVSFDVTGTIATFTLQKPLPVTCVLPPNLTAPQPINDPVVGLTPGDLVWFQVTIGSGATASSGSAVGEVTNVALGPLVNGNNSYKVTFAAGDPLNINQPAATAGNILAIAKGTGTGTRLQLITYYIDTTACFNNTPCLMRRVSGHPGVPVAENVVYLKLTYDLFNNGATLVAQDDGGASQGLTPSQITKVTIQHMSIRSQMHGVKGFESFDLQTSVSARNLTFKNEYPID